MAPSTSTKRTSAKKKTTPIEPEIVNITAAEAFVMQPNMETFAAFMKTTDPDAGVSQAVSQEEADAVFKFIVDQPEFIKSVYTVDPSSDNANDGEITFELDTKKIEQKFGLEGNQISHALDNILPKISSTGGGVTANMVTGQPAPEQPASEEPAPDPELRMMNMQRDVCRLKRKIELCSENIDCLETYFDARMSVRDRKLSARLEVECIEHIKMLMEEVKQIHEVQKKAAAAFTSMIDTVDRLTFTVGHVAKLAVNTADQLNGVPANETLKACAGWDGFVKEHIIDPEFYNKDGPTFASTSSLNTGGTNEEEVDSVAIPETPPVESEVF